MQVGDAGACRVWLTGRVEVRDLESDLRPDGASAAQVAATAFDRLGDAAHERLHGAYVVVVLDRSRQMVRVSHDHLGARTLNYIRRGRDTFFAEHLVDLLALLPATPAPDRLALVQWIDRRSLPLGRSLFSGIARLPAGHALELSGNDLTVRRFWRPAYREPVRVPRSECAAALAATAFGAVERAAADLQHPAVKLSGGLDSACVAAGLAAAANGRHAVAFGGTFPDHPEIDEGRLIEESARTAGLELVTVPHAEVAIVPPAVEYIRRWALPPGSPNTAIWERLMAQARARGVDGLLDGEGGDELFGLAPYLIADRLRAGRLLNAWRLAGQLPGSGERPPASERIHALRTYGVSGAVPRRVQRLRRRLRDSREGISPLVLDIDVPGLVAEDEQWSWKTGDGPLWWQSTVDDIVNQPERMDASGELARNSADAGVDRRHPFLHDVRLAQAVLTIPPEEHFDAIRDRPVLRDGLVGAVPEAIRTRFAKSYFNDLLAQALAGDEGAKLLEQLSSPGAPIREYVRADGLDQLRVISTVPGPRRDQLATRLFRVASADSWLRRLGDLDANPIDH